MPRLFAQGWLVLLLCSSLLVLEVLCVLATSKVMFRPDIYLRSFPDTRDYRTLAEHVELTDPQSLNDMRTWGFPLLLKLVRLITPDYFLLPWVHLVLHVAAVLTLYAGLREVGFPSPAAVLACLPPLFADLITGQMALHNILTDAFGHALMLTSFGALFLVMAQPGRPLRWLLLTLAVFAAYQTRPSYQCLIIILPLCGFLLRSFVPLKRVRALFVVDVVLASLIPFLAFCTLRLLIVGQFGLVAFTGTNLIGITGVILTEDMVADIRPEHRPMAEAILTRRVGPLAWGRLGNTFFPPIPPGGTLHDLIFKRVFYQYDEIQWEVAYPYAREQYGNDQIRIDKALVEFSLEVIRVAPELYLTVVTHSLIRAVVYIADRNATQLPLIGFCLLLIVAGVMRLWSGAPPRESSAQAQRGADLLMLISVPAILLFLGKVGLTILVAMPDPRYVDPASTLLPSIVMTAGYLVARRLWRLDAESSLNSAFAMFSCRE